MRNIRKFIHCIISSLKPHQNFSLPSFLSIYYSETFRSTVTSIVSISFILVFRSSFEAVRNVAT